MDDVLVFAEHEPSHAQLERLVEALEPHQGRSVTVLLHAHPRDQTLLGLVTAARGLPAQNAVGSTRQGQDLDLTEARWRLSHMVGRLRAAGHASHGELVVGPLPRALIREVRARSPEVLVLVTPRHRLDRWARHDLEHRLRRATSTPVVLVSDTEHDHHRS